MLKFTRDFFSHSHQVLSCTKNALCLGVNNFHILHVIDMGISQFESLTISFQEKKAFLGIQQKNRRNNWCQAHYTLKWQFGTLKKKHDPSFLVWSTGKNFAQKRGECFVLGIDGSMLL